MSSYHGKQKAQFYCTVCHAFRAVTVRREEIFDRQEADFPLGAMSRETRGKCGHQSISVYVSNAKNKARFGKSGSY